MDKKEVYSNWARVGLTLDAELRGSRSSRGDIWGPVHGEAITLALLVDPNEDATSREVLDVAAQRKLKMNEERKRDRDIKSE
jgi:hypothetical protein